jgi:hypothetical protein
VNRLLGTRDAEDAARADTIKFPGKPAARVSA